MSQNPSKSAAIAVLGSASDVSKSVIAAGLCRLLADAGLDVVPFKAQNMPNQAGVTSEGLEMPRAQILQAIACRKAPRVDMGPVLMKPVTATRIQRRKRRRYDPPADRIGPRGFARRHPGWCRARSSTSPGPSLWRGGRPSAGTCRRQS